MSMVGGLRGGSGCLLWLLVWVAPGLAVAQGRQTGLLEGRVDAPDGKPLAGVTVTITSEALVRGTATARTTAAGRFRFPELPPGTYQVVAEGPEGASAYELDVVIALAGRRELMLRLLPPAAEHEVTVVAERPTVQADRAGLSNEYGREEFSQLPGTRRGFDDILQLAPGVTRHRIPAVESGRPVVGGGTWLDNQILVDGVSYADPITNSVLTRFDFFSLEAVDVQTGGFAAEYGQAMGGVLNMVTRSGGNTHELGARGVASPGSLSAGPGATRYELNLRAGGPIVRERLWYFTSASYAYDFEPIPQRAGARLADGVTIHSPILFQKLTWQPAPSHQLSLHVTGSWQGQENGAEFVATPEAQSQYAIGGTTGQLAWRWVGDATVVQVAAQGYYRDALTTPASGDVETPSHFDRVTGSVSGNGFDINHYRSTRVGLQASWMRFVDLLGRHELKAGLDLSSSRVLYEQARPGNEQLRDAGGPCVPEQGIVDGCDLSIRSGTQLPDGSLRPGLFSTRASGLQLGLYAQDAWVLGHGVRVMPGWRMDFGRIDGVDGSRVASFDGLVGPRLAVAWDIAERGTTVLRASGARYQQTGILAIPIFFGPSFRQEYWRFNPQTRQFDILERASGGNTGAVNDPSKSRRVPAAVEATLGVEQALAEGISARVTGIYRRYENLINASETNLVWNETGSSVVGFRDGTPSPRYSLYTGPELFREYEALEVSLRGNVGKRAIVIASYTLSQLEGTSDLDELVNAENIAPTVVANPRQRQYFFGPLWGDHRHAGKIAAAWRHEGTGLSVGSTFSVVTGGPYSRLFYNAQLAQYVDRRAPRGVDPGDLSNPNDDRELRLPTTVDWSWRVAWDLERMLHQALTAELNLQNVLNRNVAQNVVEADVPAGQAGSFGSPLDRQRPFSVTLGLGYRY